MRATSPRWLAYGPDWSIAWSPTPPHLTGTAAIIAEIEARLSSVHAIPPTPTSALVPSTTSNSVAVYTALSRCERPFTASAPNFESIPGRIYSPC